MSPEPTEADVQLIIQKHRGQSVAITELKPVQDAGFDAFASTTTFAVTTDDGTSYILKTGTTPTASYSYMPNTLAHEHALRTLLASQTDIPTPAVYALDTSQTLVPYPYLLLAQPRGTSLALARASGKLSPRQLTLLELRTGAYLKTMHERVQNDWFGQPAQEADALYSWQEAFTTLMDGLLDDARAVGEELPYEDVRRALSRAIGFFLFDDCEVPSFVSFTADEHATVVEIEAGPAEGEVEGEVRVTSFGSFGHALWGDPLMETAFMDPSAGLVEGYGGPLIVFARQKTKRLWYTLFLALMVLVQAKRLGDEEHEKVSWARQKAKDCAAALKDAPCY